MFDKRDDKSQHTDAHQTDGALPPTPFRNKSTNTTSIDLFRACETPEQVRHLFSELGIPGESWRNHKWMISGSKLDSSQGGVGHSMSGIIRAISKDPRFYGSYRQFIAWMDGAKPEANFVDRVAQRNTRQDFLRYFQKLDIPNDSWRSTTYLQSRHKTNSERSLRSLNGLTTAIREDRRFGSHPAFVAWMDGKAARDKTYGERVAACKSPQDFRMYFAELGIPGENWRSSQWLVHSAKLSEEKGGVARTLTGLVSAIRKDSRFSGHAEFVAWMDGSKEVQKPMSDKVASCKSPDDFIKLLTQSGVPGDKWRNSTWLSKPETRDPSETKTNFGAFSRAVTNDPRFGSFPKFVAWMDGKAAPDPTYVKSVADCQRPEDFRKYFAAHGIPGTAWRNTKWLRSDSSKPIEDGGVGRGLAGLAIAISNDPRFGSHTKFLAWMDGKDGPDMSIRERLQQCKTQQDFREYFKELGVPGEHWRNSRWLQISAKRPQEEGGIGRTLAGVIPAIRKDPRFEGSFLRFLAWMDGNTEPEKTFVQSVQGCQTPDQFRRYFQEIGIAGDEWKESSWMSNKAKLPPEQGGIGRTMAGYVHAIRNDPRFEQSYAKFVAWMNGNADVEKTFIQRVRECKTPDDFRDYFTELKIPGEEWRNSQWLGSRAKLAFTDGGIERTLAGLLAAIKSDPRFQSWARFLSWMDGKALMSDAEFLREQLSSDEARSLEAIAAELGEAARAEYLCAKYQDRFQYNRATIQNLRTWLGPVSATGALKLEEIPSSVFTITELAPLRQALFNRMRDRYHREFRAGLAPVHASLQRSLEAAALPEQRAFIKELIAYFGRVESLPRPERLKEALRLGESFPAQHQKIVIEEMRQNRSILLADEMGGGKTGSIVSAFEFLRDTKQAHRGVILCPAQVLSVWKKALSSGEKGYYQVNQPPAVVFIENGNKDWASAAEAELIVMSIEMLRSETDGSPHTKLLADLSPDFLAIDEAHNVKNPDGSDTERLFELSQTSSITNGFLVLSSGTPMPNTVRDIASQIRLLYAGREEIEGLEIADVNVVARAITRGHPLLARNLLVRKMLRRSTEDCLPVGCDLLRERAITDLSPVERAQYDAIVGCPFYEPIEKMILLRKKCLISETKYDLLSATIERALGREKYRGSTTPPKILIAETSFARGVTRDHLDQHDESVAEAETFIAGRIRSDLGDRVKVFVLDGTNSFARERIVQEFHSYDKPAILFTLTSVAGEGLDFSFCSEAILLSPTLTVAQEEQFSRRLNRFGQKLDVDLQILTLRATIEEGISDYAQRKAQVVEEFLSGRPLSLEERKLLEGNANQIRQGGNFAYEMLTPKEKVLWIIGRLSGRGKDSIREFLAFDNGRYAKDFAAFFPLQEATSYSGNTSRLVAGVIKGYLPKGPAHIADIACGCRTMERMFLDQSNIIVHSTDINRSALEVGANMLGDPHLTKEEEVRAMDELSFSPASIDFAVLSLALHYTRHNPRLAEVGEERIRTLKAISQILKPKGICTMTFPHAQFVDDATFHRFSDAIADNFSFDILPESGLATAGNETSAAPFRVWILTLRRNQAPGPSELSPEAWSAIAFPKIRQMSLGEDGGAHPLKPEQRDNKGQYHDNFRIGTRTITFLPETRSEAKQMVEFNQEVRRDQTVEAYIRSLLEQYGEISEIPESALLSISVDQLDRATQLDRDHYFTALLKKYGSVERVPVEKISSKTDVILVRGNSRRGPFLCLARLRLDGKNEMPCGYGTRYFYSEHP